MCWFLRQRRQGKGGLAALASGRLRVRKGSFSGGKGNGKRVFRHPTLYTVFMCVRLRTGSQQGQQPARNFPYLQKLNPAFFCCCLCCAGFSCTRSKLDVTQKRVGENGGGLTITSHPQPSQGEQRLIQGDRVTSRKSPVLIHQPPCTQSLFCVGIHLNVQGHD